MLPLASPEVSGRTGYRWTSNSLLGVTPVERAARCTFALLFAFCFLLRHTPATTMAKVAAAETNPMFVDENTVPELCAATTGAGETDPGPGVSMMVSTTRVGAGDVSPCDGKAGEAGAGEVRVGDASVGGEGTSRKVGDRVGERTVAEGAGVSESVSEGTARVGEGVGGAPVSNIKADKSYPPTVPAPQDPVVGPAKSISPLNPAVMTTALSSSASVDPPCQTGERARGGSKARSSARSTPVESAILHTDGFRKAQNRRRYQGRLTPVYNGS